MQAKKKNKQKEKQQHQMHTSSYFATSLCVKSWELLADLE